MFLIFFRPATSPFLYLTLKIQPIIFYFYFSKFCTRMLFIFWLLFPTVRHKKFLQIFCPTNLIKHESQAYTMSLIIVRSFAIYFFYDLLKIFTICQSNTPMIINFHLLKYAYNKIKLSTNYKLCPWLMSRHTISFIILLKNCSIMYIQNAYFNKKFTRFFVFFRFCNRFFSVPRLLSLELDWLAFGTVLYLKNMDDYKVLRSKMRISLTNIIYLMRFFIYHELTKIRGDTNTLIYFLYMFKYPIYLCDIVQYLIYFISAQVDNSYIDNIDSLYYLGTILFLHVQPIMQVSTLLITFPIFLPIRNYKTLFLYFYIYLGVLKTPVIKFAAWYNHFIFDLRYKLRNNLTKFFNDLYCTLLNIPLIFIIYYGNCENYYFIGAPMLHTNIILVTFSAYLQKTYNLSEISNLLFGCNFCAKFILPHVCIRALFQYVAHTNLTYWVSAFPKLIFWHIAQFLHLPETKMFKFIKFHNPIIFFKASKPYFILLIYPNSFSLHHRGIDTVAGKYHKKILIPFHLLQFCVTLKFFPIFFLTRDIFSKPVYEKYN